MSTIHMVSEPSNVSKKISRWDNNCAQWLLPYVELIEENTKGRSKALLQHIDNEAPMGREIFMQVTKIMKEATCVITSTATDGTVTTRQPTDQELDVYKWDSIKKFLTKLLPAKGALHPELELSRMTKQKNESLLDFVTRYVQRANTIPDITEGKKKHILVRKLPKEIVNRLMDKDVQSITLQDIIEIVRRQLDWKLFCLTEDQMTNVKPEDWMEIGHVCEENKEEEINALEVDERGKINFKSINTATDCIKAAMLLCEKVPQFRGQMKRHLEKVFNWQPEYNSNRNWMSKNKKRFMSNTQMTPDDERIMKEGRCFQCGEKGHRRRECPLTQQKNTSKRINHYEMNSECSYDEEDTDSCSVIQIKEKKRPIIKVRRHTKTY